MLIRMKNILKIPETIMPLRTLRYGLAFIGVGIFLL